MTDIQSMLSMLSMLLTEVVVEEVVVGGRTEMGVE